MDDANTIKLTPLAIQKQSKFATLRPIFVEYPLDA